MSNGKVYGVIGGVTAFFIVFGAGLFGRFATQTAVDVTTNEIKGLTYSREAYVSSCSYWARQTPGAQDYSQAVIDNYCGCVYDRGVAQYGQEEFVRIDKEITQTNSVTPELNNIINACITQAMEAN